MQIEAPEFKMWFSLLPKTMPFSITVYSLCVAQAVWDAMIKAGHEAKSARP